jgi:hypothetical protein
MVGLGGVEVGQQGAGVRYHVGHASPFPEARQQFLVVSRDRLAAGEQPAARAWPDVTHYLADRLSDDLGLRNTPLRRRALDRDPEFVRQVNSRLLDSGIVPPVVPADALVENAEAQSVAMPKKRWSELDPRLRQALLVVGAVEAGLKLAALIDLAQRPGREIRGPKARWAAAIAFVNSGGAVPIVYFLRGRR